MPSVLIIGAGMAGLTAARELTRTGWAVTVLDKGRGVGGRLATRRIDRSRADHGAQYFSAKTSDFQQHVQQLQAAGVVGEWQLQEAEIADTSFEHPRFIGLDGMNAIAKHLAQQTDVRTNERAVRIATTPGGCAVETESGGRYEADALLITMPAPQAMDLLRQSGIELAPAELAAFSTISYQPCLAVMAVLNGPSRIPPPGAIHYEQGPVAWLADNQQKGISPEQTSVTIHASHSFSQAHLDDADLNAVGQRLLDHVAEWIPAERVVTYQVHRWRYSLAEKRHPDAFLVGRASFPLLFGGDGFGVGNVEGAFQSGMQMARWLQKQAV